MDLAVDEILPRSLHLSWVTPDEEFLNGELTHFLLQLYELDTNTSSTLISTDEEFEVGFLHPFYMYRLRLAAVTILPGPFTDDIVITTLEDGMIMCTDYV